MKFSDQLLGPWNTSWGVPFFLGGSKLTSTQKGHVPWRGTIFKRKLHLPTIHFQGILLVSGSIIWKGLEGKNNLKHLPTCPAIPSWFCHDFELLCFREMEALMTFGVSYCWLVFFFHRLLSQSPPHFFWCICCFNRWWLSTALFSDVFFKRLIIPIKKQKGTSLSKN